MGFRELDNALGGGYADNSGFATSISSAYNVNADDEAAKLKLQRETGIPAILMDEKVRSDAKLQSFITDPVVQGLPEKAPKTAEFAANQENANVMHDDLKNATKIEGLFGYLHQVKQSFQTVLPRTGKALNEFVYNFNELTAINALQRATGIGDAGKSLLDNMEWYDKRIKEREPVQPATYGQEITKMISDSVTGNLVMLPFATAGKVPALATMAATAPGQLQEYLKAGYSPSQATFFSMSNKAMEGLTELIGVRKLYDVGSYAKKAINFTAGDALGEQINNAYGQLLAKNTLDPNMTLEDFGQSVVDTALVTLGAGAAQGAMMAPIAKMSTEYQKKQQADLNKNFMLALGEAAGESKLRQRLPEKFQELVAKLKEGGDITDVHIPAEQWNTYWQSVNADPSQMADDIMEGGSKQLQEAAALGGDILIPIEVYADKLAPTQHHASLINHTRLHPGDSTSFEMSQFETEQAQMIEELKQSMGETNKPSYLKVYDDIFGQLQGIGYDRKTAEQFATISAVRAKQRAAVLGKDAFDLYNENPLKIVRPLPEGVQRQSVDMGLDPLLDRLRAGDVPMDENIFGKSLLQFVRERGVKDDRGDLKAMETNEKGKKNILRKDGMALDKVRELAAEAGYLPQDSTTADLLDAIDGELRGNARYSTNVLDSTAQDTRLALDELKDHLDRIGVDYNQLSNEQIRQQLFQGQEGGLFQGGFEHQPLSTLSNDTRKYGASYLTIRNNQLKALGYEVRDKVYPSPENSKVLILTSEVYKNGIQQYLINRYMAGNNIVFDHVIKTDDSIKGVQTGFADVLHGIESKIAQRYGLTVKSTLTHTTTQGTFKKYYPSANQDTGNPDTWRAKHEKPSQEPSHIGNLFDSYQFRNVKFDNQKQLYSYGFNLIPEEAQGRHSLPLGESPSLALFQSAYHGTPHTFDKFSLSAIGTGEGAQAYGYGLYFAGSRDVAEWYRDKLSDSRNHTDIYANGVKLEENSPERHGAALLHYNDAREIKALTKRWLKEYEGNLGMADTARLAGMDNAEYWTRLNNFVQSHSKRDIKAKSGRLYKVELAPSEDEYLLWDKPLSEQSEKVKEILKDIYPTDGPAIIDRWAKNTASDRVNWEQIQEYNDDAPSFDSPLSEKMEWLKDNTSQDELNDIAFEYADMHEQDMKMLGAKFYHENENTLHSDKAASEYLHSLGIRGIKYADGMTRNKSEQNYNYVIFSEDDIEIKEFWQKQANTKRGFFQPDSNTIGILKDADLSTFIHESSHAWLEELKLDASRSDAPEQLKFDWATIQQWLKVDGALTREQHEMFARGGEAYFMEGKAPSAELLPVFQRFKSWLVSIYKTLTGLNVKLNDDVREVFDRLLASEEEIKIARQSQNMVELFATAQDANMTETEFAAYRKAAEKAHNAEVQRLDGVLLKEKQREAESWWKTAREEIAGQVEEEAQNTPVYRAIRILSTGKMFDGTEGPVMKLDRDALVRMYGAEFIKRLPRGFGYMYSKEGGLHPDVVAEMFGFDSGDTMIREMIATPPVKQYIAAETDMRMREIYGDKLLDGTIADEAQKAIHTESRDLVLAAELKAISRQQRASQPALNAQAKEDRAERTEMQESIPPVETFKMAAAQIIADKKLGEINPLIYQQAERRAGKKAFDAAAKKDWETAGKAKQEQLLNYYLFREATKANEQITDLFTKYDKLKKSDLKLSKTRDLDMVNAARAILSRYNIDRNGLDSAEYMALIREYNPDGYQDLSAAVEAATAKARPWQQLTMEEMLAVDDAVMNLWNLSKRSRQIEIDGQVINREEVIDELTLRMDELGLPKNKAGMKQALTKWDRFSNTLVGFRAAATRVEAWVDAMDGNKPGVFRKYIWNPVIEGINSYRVAKKEYINKYLDLVKTVEKDIFTDKVESTELGYTFNGKAEILGAMLHTGNESNMEKLLVGRGWGFIAEDGGLDTSAWDSFINRMIQEGKITKADFDFIQGVWDLFEEVKPLSQKAHHEMYGYYFSEITARPLQTPFGEYRGGYAPAMSDSELNQDQANRQEKEALESTNNSFMFPSTGRGFTKSRVTYNKPLVIDLRLVPSHLDKVLRFSFVEPRVKDVGRIVTNPMFRDVLNQFNGAAGGDMLVPWLQRAARQTVETPSVGTAGHGLDQVFRFIRRNTGMQMMVANVSNTIQQFTGLALSAAKVKPTHLKSALWKYVQSPTAMAEEVSTKSDMMATRVMQSAFDMQAQAEDILLKPTKYEKVKDFSIKNGYILQQITQHTVDVVTWAAAYDQGVAEGLNEKDAVRAADSAVRMTQGSFNAEDLSRMETGIPFVRAFTQFYTYFNMQANLLASQAVGAIREDGVKGALPTLFKLYGAFAVAAIVSEAIAMAARGVDDEDEPLDIALQLLVYSQLKTGAALVPLAGQMLVTLAKFQNKKTYDDKITLAPFISIGESIYKTSGIPAALIRGDNINERQAVRDALVSIGFITSTPLGALGRPLGYLAGVESGDIRPEGTADFVRGLVTGSKGQ